MPKIFPFLVNVIASEWYFCKLPELFGNLHCLKWLHLIKFVIILLFLLWDLTRRLILDLIGRIINHRRRHVILLWILNILGRWVLVLIGIHLGSISIALEVRWILVICWLTWAIHLFVLCLYIIFLFLLVIILGLIIIFLKSCSCNISRWCLVFLKYSSIERWIRYVAGRNSQIIGLCWNWVLRSCWLITYQICFHFNSICKCIWVLAISKKKAKHCFLYFHSLFRYYFIRGIKFLFIKYFKVEQLRNFF